MSKIIILREANQNTGALITNGQAAANGRLYGNKNVNTGEVQLVIYIRNTGDTTLTIGNPALSGVDSSQFNLDLDELENTVDAGDWTSFIVSFDPSSVGIKDATVTFTHDGTNTSSPFTFGLNGYGFRQASGITNTVANPLNGVSGTTLDLIRAHINASDAHPQYQKESEKDEPDGYAGLNSSSKIAGEEITYGTTANTACEGNDPRLTGPFTPSAHATTHENGGSDEIDVTGLSGLLADAQTPLSHNHSASEITSGIIADARLADTAVTPGSYTAANITVDQKGRITAASNGSGYSDEQAQDAVGAMVGGSLVYVDGTPLLARAALTGDVTATQDSNATTIANNAVSYAKMQDVSTASKLLGRGDSGSGDPQEITLGTGLSISGTTLNASPGFTAEDAQDAVGSALTDSARIDFTYDDTANTITADVIDGSITFAKIQNAAANSKLVGSGAAGSGAPYAEITLGTGLSMSGTTLNASPGYVDEQAQDAVGSILTDTVTINFTYDDATPQITADVIDGSITYAKIQNVSATDKVLGRTSAGAGVVEEISTTGSGNVVRATSPTLVTPALGTPTALVGTNITGIASGLTAGTVTTNANLTGPITSVGNATAIASQTGTGTKFVVDDTPTLITPILGVASATSINKVAITAPATGSTLTIADGKTLTVSNDATVSGTNTGDQSIFKTISVSGQNDVVADSTSDTLTLVAGTGITLTTDDTTDSITISGATTYTNEDAQDAVGGILTDTATVDFTYDDAGNAITADVKDGSITFSKMQAITDGKLLGAEGGTTVEEISVGTGLQLASNTLSSTITQYTDEKAQDAVGGALTDTTTIDLTYDDTGNAITADVKANSIDVTLMHSTATDRLFGRDTASAGAGEEISVGGGIEFTGTSAVQRSALTGDITAPAGSNATTLATVNSNVGSFGAASKTLTATANAKGLITAIAETNIAITASQVTDFTEAAQDAVGNALVDGTTIDFTYSDAGNTITAERAALTGDVTASAGSNATTIANDAVTYAKLQNVAGFSIVGKATTGSGDAADITAADETVLGRTGGGNVAFAQVATGQIANTAVTAAKMVNSGVFTGDATTTFPALTIGNAAITAAKMVNSGVFTGDATSTFPAITISNNAITYAKLQDVAGFSVVGKATTGSGDAADITAADATVLGRTGGGNVTFGQVQTDQIASNAITTAKITDANVTLAKIANATANSKLLGSGASGSGAAYTELTLGTGLSFSGTTLNISVSGITTGQAVALYMGAAMP